MNILPCTKTYDGRTVLDLPGLGLEKGIIYGIIGANGSGKSTFAKILAGVLESDQRKKCHDAAAVGYMPQKSHGFRMSVKANLMLNGPDVAKAEDLMEQMQIAHLAAKPAHRLSGGETARMALCRLMMRSYDLVILDEPTAAMDMESTMLAEALIRRYVQETGCALILITHSLSQAQRLADRVLYLHNGTLAEQGRTAEVLSHPADDRTRRFLEFYGM